eukprot:scaffold268016_cov19-Tisochrysis_lutea.AAC.1
MALSTSFSGFVLSRGGVLDGLLHAAPRQREWLLGLTRGVEWVGVVVCGRSHGGIRVAQLAVQLGGAAEEILHSREESIE